MATFFDQVREMGPKDAIIAKVDDVVQRTTAGMDINDIRSALRGDEPRRPNPRLRPHADGFWFHIRPSFYHSAVSTFYPTLRLGWIATFMFAWETITGIFLMIFYTPEPGTAYSDMWNILGNVPFGQLMRNMHRLGAELMVLSVALHMLRTFVTGSYKKPRQFTWVTGILLLVFTLMLSFSGYLLPWDQLAYWAFTVFLSGAEAAPAPVAVNRNILLILQGAPTVGAGGLLRWYLIHVLLLPLLTGFIFFMHYYKVVLYGISLPPGMEEIGEDTAKRVPKDQRRYFIPDLMTQELMWTSLLTLLIVAGSLWFWDAPLEHQANPLVTPLHVVAPWYLSWSQGWLKLAPKTVVVGFIPLLMVMFIFMPYVEIGKSRRYADRRVGLTVAALFFAFMLMSNWMGSPEYRVQSSPEAEVSQSILPQEGPSPLLGVPFEDLEVGTYLPGQHVDNPHLAEALIRFEEAMVERSCTKIGDPRFRTCREIKDDDGNVVGYANHFTNEAMPDPFAELKIELVPGQENMKRLILHYEVDDPVTGVVDSASDRVSFRHEDSNYEEECAFANKDC